MTILHIFKWIISFFVIVAVVFIAIVATQPGLYLTYAVVKPFIPGKLQFKALEGSLVDHIKIKGLHYELNNNIITADMLSFKWRWRQIQNDIIYLSNLNTKQLYVSQELFHKKLHLEHAQGDLTIKVKPELDIVLQAEGKTTAINHNSDFKIDLKMNSTDIEQADVILGSSFIKAKGSYQNTLNIESEYKFTDLRLIDDNIRGSARGTLHVTGKQTAPQVDLNLTGKNLVSAKMNINTFKLKAEGPLSKLALSVQTVQPDLETDFDFIASKKSSGWSFIFDKGHLKTRYHGEWSTEKDYTINFENEIFESEKQICFYNDQRRSLCGELHWDMRKGGEFKIQAKHADISFLVPQIDEISTDIQASIQSVGTKKNPQYSGKLQINHLNFKLPVYGIEVLDGALTLTAKKAQ